ncbi:hypothetical protein D1BOALGB6SA_9282 [Olavius sp. associated proteobacterium Delta 1]|nr:hypothetical protein D1BOALGB6SA_9282 [Olavius sp. associated proteobacterium Delta 1]
MEHKDSIVKKTESAIDDFIDLWKRRKGICIIAIAIIIVPTCFTLFQQYIAIPKIQSQIVKKDQKISLLENRLKETIREKDKAEIKLSPFLAAADRHFSKSPPDERLNLLVEKIDSLIKRVESAAKDIKSKRILSIEAISKIKSRFSLFPPLSFIITSIMGDQESMQLGEQIKRILEEAGQDVKGVNQSLFTQPVFGLRINVYELPPKQIQAAIAPFFNDLGYKRVVGLKKELKPNQIEIIVGSK